MLVAKVKSLHHGWDRDALKLKELGAEIGDVFTVEKIDMRSWYTDVYLKGIAGAFNSVNFEFLKDGEPHDIFNDPDLNPYLPPHIRSSLEKPYCGTIKQAAQYRDSLIAGYIEGHTQVADGEWFHTSRVVAITKNDDGTFKVETRNSFYTVEFKPGSGFMFRNDN